MLMDITPKDLEELIGCKHNTIDTYICRYPKVVKKRNGRNVYFTNVTQEIINSLIIDIYRNGIIMKRHEKEKQYDKYYHIKNKYNQCAADCFDFNFSYDRENKNTCFSNYDNPCKCKVLSGEYCKFLAAQKREEV